MRNNLDVQLIDMRMEVLWDSKSRERNARVFYIICRYEVIAPGRTERLAACGEPKLYRALSAFAMSSLLLPWQGQKHFPFTVSSPRYARRDD